MKNEERIWHNEKFENCPFPQSSQFSGILLTGRYANYTNADTFYPSWGSDGNLYCPWTDGYIGEDGSFSMIGNDGLTQTGQVKIVGDDPFNLEIVNLGHMTAVSKPFGGRYPSGCLMYNGVWYHGSYCLTNTKRNTSNVGWTKLGPFVGFRTSSDWEHYTTSWDDGYWKPCPHTSRFPLFREHGILKPIKIGAPHFVDFGKNMEHSPDGKAYMVAHGSSKKKSWNSWIQGDEVYLVRAYPEKLNDYSAYEFYGGKDEQGRDIWTHKFKQIRPIAKWDSHLGCVTMTYNAPLNKYFMCITRGVIAEKYDTMILESDSITGPWNMVHYMKAFGPEAYFVNIPSKFISDDGKTAMLWYSANFSDNPWGKEKTRAEDPIGSNYSLVVQEIKLMDNLQK
ncbi:MAG: hypothetical protein ACI4XC_05780 [Eubacterium sp.]